MDWQGWAMVAAPILLGVPAAAFRWLMKTLKGINEKLDSQGEELMKVKQHVTPNHGSSLRDVVDRIEDMATEMHGSYTQHLKQSEYDTERFDRAITALNGTVNKQ